MTDALTLADLIARHAVTDGMFKTVIPGVTLIRASAPTVPMPVIYDPTVCFVAQGRKRASVANTAYVYDPTRYLVASVDLPVMGSVIEASLEQPYLSLQLDLDTVELADLAIRHPIPGDVQGGSPGALTLGSASPDLLGAVTRLAGLLDAPDDREVLAPLIIREILYRLLMAPDGAVVRQMARADSRLSQIAKAIAWVRANFREPCRIEDAAEIAGMSRSNFHLHFKAVTMMSPIEFRTQLRLQEARRLMVAEALDAATAGFNVGYESPSHFSRDYARIFGAPPATDAQRLRADVGPWAIENRVLQ